ncbi:hypothetical protein WH47_05231 [Habropoda laboriosa]|uniref:Uncharacterized protein n=1 Tax=Habropoda laboriosa TaxID=597456 RepID=A0A0L7QUA1_9HYME|nr:hypothetical protein WH47_05231 [Habropoda laboriosa]
MGPAVVISVVRRSHTPLKKKQRYESLQLQEYRWDTQKPYKHQMVSENIFLIARCRLLGEHATRCVRRFARRF